MEAGPAGQLALNLDLAAVFLHNPVDDREPETRAVVLGRKKWIENVRHIFRFDPAAVVLHAHAQDLARLAGVVRQRGWPGLGRADFGCDCERTPGFHGVERIDEKVEKHLLNLICVGADCIHIGMPGAS